MGLINSFKEDFKNFWKWMPSEIKIYEEKEKGIEAGQIKNPPNPYVPQRIEWVENKKKGKLKFHLKKMNDESKKLIDFKA